MSTGWSFTSAKTSWCLQIPDQPIDCFVNKDQYTRIMSTGWSFTNHTSPEAFFGFKKKPEETEHNPCTVKFYRLQKQYAVKYLCSFSKEILINARMAQNLKITIIHGNVNFIRECSSRAHFKGNFMQIKNQIGTIPLKSLVSPF